MTRASARAESVDELLRLLADSRRRTLLRVLDTGPTRKSIHEVVDRVVDESRRGDRTRIRTELHHKHLPVLDDCGIVDYDPEDGTVAYTPGENVESLLDTVVDLETDGS